MSFDLLRQALIRAPAGAVYVYGGDVRVALTRAQDIPRHDLTIVGTSILCEEAVAELGSRPIYVDPSVVLNDQQRKVLAWHERRNR